MEITVLVKDVTEKFTLRTHIGEGSYGGVSVKLASSIPEASPIVEVDDRMFYVSMHDIARAILEQVVE